jgi:hypothetical protein
MRPDWLSSAASRIAALSFGWAAACTPIQIGGLGGLDTDAGAGDASAAAGRGGSASGGVASSGISAGGTVSGGAASGRIAAGGNGSGAVSVGKCEGAAVAIEGRLTSPRGAPLAGATVTLAGAALSVIRTDAEGRYRFSDLCVGGYTVTPSHPSLGFCPERATNSYVDREIREDFSASAGGCEPVLLERRLLALVYDPLVDAANRPLSSVESFEDPVAVVERLARALTAYSNGRVHYRLAARRTINAFPAQTGGAVLDAAAYSRCLERPADCAASEADYAALENGQGICSLVDDGQVDEVWLLGGRNFGFAPLRAPTVSCRRLLDIAGFDYSRGVPLMLEAFQARAEAALGQALFEPVPARRALDAFLHVASEATGDARSGCGNVHTPPNTTTVDRFDDATLVASYCDAYLAAPVAPLAADAPTKPVSCQAWFCQEADFRRYWFQHLPRQPGLDLAGKLRDWWRYVVSPDDRAARGPVRCSTSYASGWCDSLVDGKHGSCNDFEWATAKSSTGWAEFTFPEARPVHEIQIYARACEDRVVAGHVEFSDGSAPVSFGPLASKDEKPTVLEFPEKMLTFLTVFIDESDGPGNPGFAEIIIN